MSLVNAANLAYQFPSTENLFENLTFTIKPGDRIAITGPNGCGKTTLLRLLEGVLEPTTGTLVRRSGLACSSAAQEGLPGGAATLFDFIFEARRSLASTRRRLAILEQDDPIEWASALDDYHREGGFSAEARTTQILCGLGFMESEFTKDLCALSSGERRRAALARALNAETDLILLDEPTNHLDAQGREWLAAELAVRSEATVVISHDRALLRAFANRIIDIGRRTSTVFEGGYDEWRTARAVRERQAWAEYEAAQRRRAAAEEAAAKRAALARKVAAPPDRAHHSHDFYRRKAAKVDRTARILRERSAVEATVPKPFEEQPIPKLDFGSVARAGDFPLRASGLAKSFGTRKLLSGVEIQLPAGARLSIVGPNGCGKTTLLRILARIDAPDSGTVEHAAGVRLGCLLQDASNQSLDRTPLETCGTSAEARTLMGCLKLRPDCVNRPLSALSPGERAKVSLVQILTGGANLLLLDEPTEHLEIEAQEALEQTLATFPGTLVVVSHDREFLSALGPSLQTFELAPKAHRSYLTSRGAP